MAKKNQGAIVENGGGPQVGPTAPPWASTTEFVTPDMARALLMGASYEYQRPSRDWHVDEIAEIIKNEEHVPRAIKIDVLPDGREFVVDGQHFLRAIDQGNRGEWCTVMRVPVEDMDQIAHDYSNTDRAVARTRAETVRAYNLREMTGFSTAETNALAGALKVLADGFQSSSLRMNRPELRNQHQIVEGMRDWAQEAKELFHALRGGSNVAMRAAMLQAPFAVALVTMRYQPERGFAFWHDVTHSSSEKGNPAAELRERLIFVKGERTRPNELARITATAWNFFYEDRELKKLGPGDTDKYIKILGTPLDGTRILRLAYPPLGDNPYRRPARPLGNRGASAPGTRDELDEDLLRDGKMSEVQSELAPVG